MFSSTIPTLPSYQHYNNIIINLQDANALMLGEFPVVMDLVGSVEAAKEAKQQVVIVAEFRAGLVVSVVTAG